MSQLIDKYKAIKRDLRKAHSEQQRYVKGTGGGPYKPPPPPPTEEEKILSETIKLSIEGLTNNLDMDGIRGITGVDCSTFLKGKDEYKEDSDTEADWGSASAKLWQTPKHPKRNIKQKNYRNNENTPENILELPVVIEHKKITPVMTVDEIPNINGDAEAHCDEGSVKLWQTPNYPKLNLKSKYINEENIEASTVLENSTGERSNIRYHFLEASTSTENSTEERKDKDNILTSEPDFSGKKSDGTKSGLKTQQCWVSRRRPVLKKKKCAASAAQKFEVVADKKKQLLTLQMKLTREKLLQNRKEHKALMLLTQLKTNTQKLKAQMLKNGTLSFEFKKKMLN